MVTTETEIETEVKTEIETEVEKETEVKTKPEIETDVNLQELNEIAKSKQKLNYDLDEFEKVKKQYAKIEQNNTELETIEEVEEHETDNKIEESVKPILKTKHKQKLSSRLKLFLICSSIVLLLSASLLIYNGVQIAITKNEIASIEREIATGKASYDSALKQLKHLTETDELTERAIELDMRANSETIEADLIETKLDTPQNEHTNWFNDLCNFIATLFN